MSVRELSCDCLALMKTAISEKLDKNVTLTRVTGGNEPSSEPVYAHMFCSELLFC